MVSSVLVVTLASVWGQVVPEAVVEKQDEMFQRLWAEDFEWKFNELPTDGTVASVIPEKIQK